VRQPTQQLLLQRALLVQPEKSQTNQQNTANIDNKKKLNNQQRYHLKNLYTPAKYPGQPPIQAIDPTTSN
jgi:hypothetical protein